MKNILTIFKKEWDRVIHDRRLVIMVMILPGLMIFLIYTFIGSAMTNMTTKDIYRIGIVNPQPDFETIYENFRTINDVSYDIQVLPLEKNRISEYQTKIDNGDWDLLIIFSDGIENYDSTGDKPVVELYSNLNKISSSAVANDFKDYLNYYENVLSQELYGDTVYFKLDSTGTPLDQNTLKGRIIGSLIPMLIIMFLFSGAMSIGPESIAGEKERGTMATLLVTPVKRREIAIGKISALSILTLMSAASSFIGILFSLPKMMQFGDGMTANIYGFKEYLMILLILFSTVFIIVGIISVISAYAKNLKEAQGLITPVYILTILVSVTSMFGDTANKFYLMYLIPIYNSVQSLTAILSFDQYALSYITITIISNLIYLSIFIYILNKMFNSERIMFAK